MIFNRKVVLLVIVLVMSFGTMALQAQNDIPDGTPINYGDVVTSELTEDAPDEFYSFEGSAGDVVDISLSADFDTYLYLFDSRGVEVTYNDDGGDSLDSRIFAFELPANDVYTIRATSFSYRNSDPESIRTGDYTLSLNRIESTVVDFNSTVSAAFSAETQVLYFTFEGSDGAIVDLIVNSGNSLDTKLTLVSPYGYDQATNNDAPGSVDPALFEESLQGDGTFIVIIEPQNPNATLNGEITFTVGGAELASLDAGPVMIELGGDRDNQSMTFEGVRGEVVRVEVTVASREDYTSPTFEITQDGTTLVNLYGASGIDYLAFDFLVQFDGPINMTISAYSDYTAEVSIIRDPQADDE